MLRGASECNGTSVELAVALALALAVAVTSAVSVTGNGPSGPAVQAGPRSSTRAQYRSSGRLGG